MLYYGQKRFGICQETTTKITMKEMDSLPSVFYFFQKSLVCIDVWSNYSQDFVYFAEIPAIVKRFEFED